MGATGFFFIDCLYGSRLTQASHANISRLRFYVVRWSARRGLRDSAEPAPQTQNQEALRDEKFARKEKARRGGPLGETYGYWYLRRQGYVFIAENYMPQGAKGQLDLVGYDGETIAFVEIRTRAVREDISGLPELSVGYAKQYMLVRTAQRFLADRHLHDCQSRFDVLAIDNIRGRPPEIRLHKDAFSPQLRRSR
ncbi:MAG: putative endonuclease [Acidobacteriaceae bacterium]|nr:putative endonuclease [Acidobacteriaceae bacterium]